MPKITIANGYDLMAWLCQIICDFDEDKQRLLYKKFTSKQSGPENYYHAIERQFSFLKRTEGKLNKCYDMLLPEQIDQIKTYVLLWKEKENDCILVLAMLSYLDRYFDVETSLQRFKLLSHYVADNVISFRALNNNATELKGMLLPNFVPRWERKVRSSRALAENPLSVIENYIWVCHNEIWKVTNLYSDEWSFTKDRNFKIVCSPLTNLPTFSYDLYEQEPYNRFEITEYHSDRMERVKTTIEQTIRFANQNGADVVLFPEMVASPQCLDEMSEFVEQQTQIVALSLIVLPSAEYYIAMGNG